MVIVVDVESQRRKELERIKNSKEDMIEAHRDLESLKGRYNYHERMLSEELKSI